MGNISNDIIWFCNQLHHAEETLAKAIDKTENFSSSDKQIVGKILPEVKLIDISLLQLLSPKRP